MPGVILPTEAPRRPRRPGRVLACPDVDADAQGRGTVWRYAVLVSFVTQLFTLQPHRLLVLLVTRELAEHFLACGQSRGPRLGQRRRLATEGAGDAFRGVATILICRRNGHEARQALQAEGVCAVQLLGCLEDIVIDVVADGTLRLTHDWDPSLWPSLLGGHLHVPNLWSLLHLQKCGPLLFFCSLKMDYLKKNCWNEKQRLVFCVTDTALVLQ